MKIHNCNEEKEAQEDNQRKDSSQKAEIHSHTTDTGDECRTVAWSNTTLKLINQHKRGSILNIPRDRLKTVIKSEEFQHLQVRTSSVFKYTNTDHSPLFDASDVFVDPLT